MKEREEERKKRNYENASVEEEILGTGIGDKQG